MAKKLQPPPVVKLADENAERVRRAHHHAIREIQASPLLGAWVRRDIELPDGVNVPISHGLGRTATILTTPPRFSTFATTGRLREVRDPSFDSKKFVVLRATGWSETITVDAVLF